MGDYHTVYKGPEGETTQWDDIQRKLGNLAPKEPVWKPYAYKPEEEEQKDEKFLENKEIDELEELEDDFEDDRFLEEYRRKRIEELQKGSTRPRFGSLETIRGSEFVAQVTNAGEGIWVVCHLYKDSVQDCGILNACFTELASRYPNTKFVKIVSTDCIPGYPDENLPTVLLYKDTKCVHNLVGLNAFGGKSTSPDRVALILNQLGGGQDNGGLVCGESADDTAAQVRGGVKELLEKRTMFVSAGKRDENDEDSDFDD